MSQFTERHHAYIVAKFYELLKNRHSGLSERIFVMATRRYAEQRGGRMAQRALRDGRTLDFSAYREYGEWTNTASVIAEGHANDSENLSEAPDLCMRITGCPWAAQFADMGMSECGVLYCRHVDESIARGFNPELTYEVLCSLNDHDCCLHVLRGAGEIPPPGAKKPENMRDFSYHCGHVYKTFSELVCAITGDAELPDLVLDAFAAEYGSDMAEELAGWLDEDFNLIDGGAGCCGGRPGCGGQCGC